jgi:hypothetical protein
MNSHKEIIELWPTRAEFAREVGVSYQTARQWYARDGIPARHWPEIVNAARKRNFSGVTLETLVAIEAGRPVDDADTDESIQQDEGGPVSQGELKLQAAE